MEDIREYIINSIEEFYKEFPRMSFVYMISLDRHIILYEGKDEDPEFIYRKRSFRKDLWGNHDIFQTMEVLVTTDKTHFLEESHEIIFEIGNKVAPPKPGESYDDWKSERQKMFSKQYRVMHKIRRPIISVQLYLPLKLSRFLRMRSSFVSFSL